MRVFKKKLELNTKIANESKEIIQNSVSEFLTFVLTHSELLLQRNSRKKLQVDDIHEALVELGLSEILDP